MSQNFSQADVFPIIARLIHDLHAEKQDFVTHDELVEAFLNNAAGNKLIDHAYQVDEGQKSKEWWASNMVQWFSQRITEEKSKYASQFERTTIKGAWAYRPVCEPIS